MNVAVACGGTGGHIFPGLAVAEALRKREHRVVLWLAGRTVEHTALAGWDGAVVSVQAAGFPAGVSVRSAAIALRLSYAVGRCILRMRTERPDVLLAMGSYASVGPVLAARAFRIPVVLHEANAVPGRAVSFLSRFAATVGVTFEAAGKAFGRKSVVTGLPLRADLRVRFPDDQLERGVFTILVMGGSQGAHVLNEIGSQAVCALRKSSPPIQVVHLTGSADEDRVRTRYREAGVRHLVFPFLADMGLAYGAADVAISRSGAASCMELAACAVPALLVPLPSARRDHQTANARAFASAGAAVWVPQSDLSAASMQAHLARCLTQPERLRNMRQAAASMALPDAADRLARVVERTAAGRRTRA